MNLWEQSSGVRLRRIWARVPGVVCPVAGMEALQPAPAALKCPADFPHGYTDAYCATEYLELSPSQFYRIAKKRGLNIGLFGRPKRSAYKLETIRDLKAELDKQ